jgi:MFS family permease
MSLAMVAGNFVYGPIDRWLGTRKIPILVGNLPWRSSSCRSGSSHPPASPAPIIIFALIGFFGASYPIVISHGRSFLPAHLTGRGVTLLNLFGMGGAGVMQFASGPVYANLAEGSGPAEAFGPLFALFALVILIGMAAYSSPATGRTEPAQHLPHSRRAARPEHLFPLPRPSCKRRAS